ncbi:MAG TPA: hypothetical protein VGP93_19160 [Polyangiaceae bacterium]|nr:hypothetical protein [Polyangiaceae bacterium]
MTTSVLDSEPGSVEPDIDENGVDRVQIRRALALEPEERLRQAQEVIEGLLEIWELNGTRPIR